MCAVAAVEYAQALAMFAQRKYFPAFAAFGVATVAAYYCNHGPNPPPTTIIPPFGFDVFNDRPIPVEPLPEPPTPEPPTEPSRILQLLQIFTEMQSCTTVDVFLPLIPTFMLPQKQDNWTGPPA